MATKFFYAKQSNSVNRKILEWNRNKLNIFNQEIEVFTLLINKIESFEPAIRETYKDSLIKLHQYRDEAVSSFNEVQEIISSRMRDEKINKQ